MPRESAKDREVPGSPAPEGREEEKTKRHGHGMSSNRTPKDGGLPHEGDREQPYAREVEDYSGRTANPPTEKTGRERTR